MERKGNVVADYSSLESRAFPKDAEVIDVFFDVPNRESMQAANTYKQIETASSVVGFGIDLNI